MSDRDELMLAGFHFSQSIYVIMVFRRIITHCGGGVHLPPHHPMSYVVYTGDSDLSPGNRHIMVCGDAWRPGLRVDSLLRGKQTIDVYDDVHIMLL